MNCEKCGKKIVNSYCPTCKIVGNNDFQSKQQVLNSIKIADNMTQQVVKENILFKDSLNLLYLAIIYITIRGLIQAIIFIPYMPGLVSLLIGISSLILPLIMIIITFKMINSTINIFSKASNVKNPPKGILRLVIFSWLIWSLPMIFWLLQIL